MIASECQTLLSAAQPVFWINDRTIRALALPEEDVERAVEAAERRLSRSSALLMRLFPDTAYAAGAIRSALASAGALQHSFGLTADRDGRWLIKADHALPVAGSIKARGGFHEVIALAERLALTAGLIDEQADLARLADADLRALFGRHRIAVGSTGNLGMSIGLMAAALGFQAVVHMSHDAKAWKKTRLRDHGVTVIEHEGDYAQAVAAGRAAAAGDAMVHFVDDEHSIDLFVGYATAARELADQLRRQGVKVDRDHPLFVYLPCGVGGAPGGITYGLKRIFGDDVRCFFAEPIQSPCMALQLMSGAAAPVSVYDAGLTNRTEADGLAVAQASPLVAPLMQSRLEGVYTVADDELLALVRRADETLGMRLEPSAAAGIAGPVLLTRSPEGRAYLARTGLEAKLGRSTHILWTTGGQLLPDDQFETILSRASSAIKRLDTPKL